MPFIRITSEAESTLRTVVGPFYNPTSADQRLRPDGATIKRLRDHRLDGECDSDTIIRLIREVTGVKPS